MSGKQGIKKSEAREIVRELAGKYGPFFNIIKADAEKMTGEEGEKQFVNKYKTKIGMAAQMLQREVSKRDGIRVLRMCWKMVQKGQI